MSDERFGLDGEEGLIFDRTKPCTQGEDTEGLYEEVTLPELIEIANSLVLRLQESETRRDGLTTEWRAAMDEVARLSSRLGSVEKLVADMAQQLTPDEMGQAARGDADFEGGYDVMVGNARELKRSLYPIMVERQEPNSVPEMWLPSASDQEDR